MAFGRAYVIGDTDARDFPLVNPLPGPIPRLDNVFVSIISSALSDCLLGNVNAAAGPIAPVLFVNDSTGGTAHEVLVRPDQPFTIFMSTPPSAAGTTRFALYIWAAEAREDTVQTLPYGIGASCLPTPLNREATPQPKEIFNNLGHYSALGVPTRPSSPAPSLVLSLPRGIRKPSGTKFFLQGFIQDSQAPNGQLAVTNGIQGRVE